MTDEKKKPRELAPGDRRRMADGKNAWRKMTPEQRGDYLAWIGRVSRADVVSQFNHLTTLVDVDLSVCKE